MYTLLEIGLSNALAATLLALVAWVGSRVCRRPALAHGLWLLVLVKLLTPPLLQVPMSWEASTRPPPPEPAAAVPQAATPEPPDREEVLAQLQALERAPDEAGAEPTPPALDVRQGVALLWLTGSVLWFGWIAAYLLRFRRLLRPATAAPTDLEARVEELARCVGLRRAPRVVLIPGRLSPMVWSFLGRPSLLFPTGLLEQLSVSQRDTLILHELAHLARRDHWVRWLELLASGLYWWLPVVWLTRRELHAAEEECCDARVIDVLPGSGRAYALALVQTLAFLSPSRRPPLPVAASGVGPVPQIQRRLMMILGNQSSPSLTRLGGMALLTLAVLGLPWAPGLAQQKPEPTPTPGQLRQQQIEALRQLLKTLEEQQRAEENTVQSAVRQTAVKALQEWRQAIPAPKKATQSAPEQWQRSYADFTATLSEAARSRVHQKLGQQAQAKPTDATQAAEAERLKAQIAQAEAEIEQAKARLKALQAALKQLAQPNPATKTPADSPAAAYLQQRLEALDRQLQVGKLSSEEKRQLGEERAQVEKLLKSLGGAAFWKSDFHAIPLRTAKAGEMAKALNEIFNTGRISLKRNIHIVADERTNTLLIRADNPEDLATVQKVLEKFMASEPQKK
jgi:beta-lactamase regulating signal transducer with metallopeptidase domain